MLERQEVPAVQGSIPLGNIDGELGEGEWRVGGCLAACPIKDDGAPCLKTCTLNQGHYGSHMCPEGHRWS